MVKSLKKTGLIAAAVLMAVLWVALLVLRSRLEHRLADEFKRVHGRYVSLQISLSASTMDLQGLSLTVPLKGKGSDSVHLRVGELRMRGISYVSLLLRHQLQIDRVEVQACRLTTREDLLQGEALPTIRLLPLSIGSVVVRSFAIKGLAAASTSPAKNLSFEGNVSGHGLVLAREGGTLRARTADYRIEVWHLAYSEQLRVIAVSIGHLLLGSGPTGFQCDRVSIKGRVPAGGMGGHSPGALLEGHIHQLKAEGIAQGTCAHSAIAVQRLFVDSFSLHCTGSLPKKGGFSKWPQAAFPFLSTCMKIEALRVGALFLHYQKGEQHLTLQGTTSMRDLHLHSSVSVAALQLRISNARYYTDGGLYLIQMHDGIVDSRGKLVKLRTLDMTPLYGKLDFGRKVGHQADRITARLRDIAFRGVEWNKLLDGTLVAEAAGVGSSSIAIFRDRRLPRLLSPQPMPIAALKGLPVGIQIKKVLIENSAIGYEEQPNSGEPPGMLKTRIRRLLISPLVNRVGKQGPAAVSVLMEGSIADAGTVSAHMELPLSGPACHLFGSIRMLDLTALNSGAENLGHIRIQSGLLDSLGFDVYFDENRAQGKIVGVYHDLRLQKLKKQKDGKIKVARFPSFVLRHLIIPLNKDRSLAEGKRTGRIFYQRDPTRNLSYYLLQSLLSGIKSSFKLGYLLPK